MTGGCDLIRVSLGAYAVDALDPAERASLDAHLARCEDCKRELVGLSEVAGLLAGVPLRDIQRAGLLPANRSGGSRRELERRVRPVRARRAGAALALAAVVASALALVFLPGGHRSPVERLSASGTDRATGVFARITLQRRASGTAATLSLQGVRPHLHCRLMIISRHGERETAASWQADYEGTADVTARSDIPITAVASVEVLAGHHQRLIRIPVHAPA